MSIFALSGCSRKLATVVAPHPAKHGDNVILVKPTFIGPKFDKDTATTITWQSRKNVGNITLLVSVPGLCTGESATADSTTHYYIVNSTPASSVTCTVAIPDDDTDFQYIIQYPETLTHIQPDGPLAAHVGSCKNC